MKVARDPTGLTPGKAKKLAEALFTKHPTLGSVYKGHTMIATAFRCAGQVRYSGRKTTRSCSAYWHLQPCPGGPIIFRISRLYPSPIGLLNVIEAEADSWQACLDRIVKTRELDRAAYANTPTKKARR